MSEIDYRVTAYAMGVLDSQERIQFERELEADKELQRAISEVEQVLQVISPSGESLAPSAGLRDSIMASVNKPFDGFVTRLSIFLDLSTKMVSSVLERVDAGRESLWEPGPGQGIYLQHFDGGPRVASADCGFVKLEPGARFPSHRHVGDEWAFIIQGQVEEDDGRKFYPGDVSFREAGSEHSFVSSGTEPLVLVAVVHRGLEFLPSNN